MSTTNEVSKPQPTVSFRVDKNLALNTLDFRVFNEDTHYARKLIYYICYQYFANPIDFGVIDPKDFCSKMNISFTRMKQIVHDPEQLKEKNRVIKRVGGIDEGDDEIAWKTRFENILFKLNATVFKYSYGGQTNDGYEYKKIVSGTLLRSISMQYMKFAKTKKKYYTFELDPQIVNNLTRWFNEMDFECFVKLSEYQDILAYLHNLKQTFQSPQFNGKKVIVYELLCKLADTNCSEFSDNKKVIWRVLNLIKNTDKKLGICVLKWVNSGRNDKVLADIYIDFTSEKMSFESNFDSIVDRHDSKLIADLKAFFRVKYKEYSFPLISSEEENKLFKSWYKSIQDMDVKIDYYEKAKKYICGNNVKIENNEGLIFFQNKHRSYTSDFISTKVV